MEDLNLEYDYEYNVVDVANYKADKARSSYYKFIELNHSSMDGDLVESGVFRGRSLIATALLLKDLGSTKKVYGFDSFSGFLQFFMKTIISLRLKDYSKKAKLVRSIMMLFLRTKLLGMF